MLIRAHEARAKKETKQSTNEEDRRTNIQIIITIIFFTIVVHKRRIITTIKFVPEGGRKKTGVGSCVCEYTKRKG